MLNSDLKNLESVSGYHGGQISGGDCMQLMRNIDCLAQMCPIFVLPFVSAFRSFQKVVLSCFSTNLSASFRADIEAFRKDCTSLRISITPKILIILEHVPFFVSNLVVVWDFLTCFGICSFHFQNVLIQD